jgi:type IV pilus assembly protein PilC
MPLFTYVARDLDGTDHKGTIETVDNSRAAAILSKRGLTVISVKQKNEAGSNLFASLTKRVSFTDVVIATRQLSTMIESGLVVSDSFDVLSEQQSNPEFKKVLQDVSRDVKGGLDLASAMKKHPKVFNSMYCSLVKAGEEGGNLDVVLQQMATSMEKDREFRSKVKSALIYPIIVVLMMVIVMSVMMFFVVPRLTSLYSQSNLDLPLPTKILIGVSNAMLNYWWLMLIIGGGGFFAFKKWIATTSGKEKFDRFLLKIPVIGKIITETSLTNFTRTFGLLTSAGIPLLEALTISGDVVGNSVFKNAIQLTLKGVERGLSFSAQLETIGVFPRLLPQMFKVGEETGKVDKVSFKLAEYYETESDHMLKNLTVIIEPFILMILGISVAFLVLSIILPIYNLTTNIS